MKTTITWMAVLTMSFTAVPATAQEMGGQHETMSPMAGMCRMMQGMHGEAEGGMMGGMMGGGMMMSGGMMGGMIQPKTLLAAKDVLGLSADQVSRLEELAKASPMGNMAGMQGMKNMEGMKNMQGMKDMQGMKNMEGMKDRQAMMQQHMAARKAALEVLTDQQRAQLETSMKLMHSMMGAMCEGMANMQHTPGR